MESPDRLAAAGSEFPGNAAVYVFRYDDFAGGAWSIEVLVDNASRASLRTKTFTSFSVAPGTRDIKFHWMSLGMAANPDMLITADLAADKTYYFTFGADADVQLNTLPTDNKKSTFRSLVSQISKQKAQSLESTFARRESQ